MGSGWGNSGPRTNEQKNWLTEIKKGILLTIIIWVALCLLWLIVSGGIWFLFPDSKLARWFLDHPRWWVAANGALAVPCLIGLINWARQELLDADWTSLQGKHALSGVMPMTPLVRLVFFVRWLRGQPKAEKKPFSPIEAELLMRLKDENDE